MFCHHLEIKYFCKIKIFKVFLYNLVFNYRNILGGLTVVLEDDCNVHVDDDEEADDEICEQEGDGHNGVSAVSLVPSLRIS